MKPDSSSRKVIDELAMAKLGCNLPKIRSDYYKFIPKPPTGHKNETRWLLRAHAFNLKQACRDFIKIHNEIHPTMMPNKIFDCWSFGQVDIIIIVIERMK